MTVYEKIARRQVQKGSIHASMIVFLLVICALISPFAVAFWITGIMTPKNARDWVVLIFYTIVLVATICFLSLYVYARLKRKRYA